MKKIAVLTLALLLVGCAVNKDQQPSTIPTTVTAAPITTKTTQPSTEATIAVETTAQTVPVTLPPDPYEVLMDSMTTEELVGQLFLARYPGHEYAQEDLKAFHLGGYILFSRDFEGENPESIQNKLHFLQESAKIPLLMAVDEEGGTVARLSGNPGFRSSRFPSPRKLYTEGGIPNILETEEEKCTLLRASGINVNMAPVCDITTDSNAFMYRRSLGQSPEIIGQFVRETVSLMGRYQVGSVLKHFPGYGNNADTHIGSAVDHRSLEELEQYDLVPFAAGTEAGCDAILISHTVIGCLDDSCPATLSPAVIGYLREDMGFDGVIITDDLQMEAITDVYGTGEAAVMAVLAGNDLLCSSEYTQQYQAVLQAVKDGTIPMEQVRNSVSRILKWKNDLGLNIFGELQ